MSDSVNGHDSDPSAKDDLEAYQPGFLEECQAALDAGFPPGEDDPEYMTDEEIAAQEAGS